MALYDDKGTDELTGKLEGFMLFFKEKTGRDLDKEELKKALSEIHEQKKRSLIVASFGTETVGTLQTLIERLDELLPKVEVPLPKQQQKHKRKRESNG